MPHLTHLSALEILDSRGRPTVKATVRLASGAAASASVPSGASTGAAEAIELRDRDPHRYAGLGCRAAVAHVNGEIAQRLAGRQWLNQAAVDQTLIALDGTPDKSRLGANAILATSIAFARAYARDAGVELHEHFRAIAAAQYALHSPRLELPRLPRLTINLFSGGKHAGGQVEFQDLLLVPLAPTIAEGLAQVDAVYRAAEKLIARKYNQRSLKADEGGLAPPFPDVATLLADAAESVAAAGYELGKDVALAIDVASSHFYSEGQYHLAGQRLTAQEMTDRIADLVRQYHIVSVEDALAEDDWPHCPALRSTLAPLGALTLGDDFLCTNPVRIRRAIDERCADALLLKVNQIGTLTEAAEALRLARSANWRVTVSARSGETEDDWLADLAVGWS
ncbi:MAG: enolase C-terminal domain-like protein, partial [Phycisphaerae bacterium]